MLNQTDQKRLGIFFYYQTANRLADFPARLDGILERDNVMLYDAVYEGEHGYMLELVAEPWLSRVHSQRMMETIRSTAHYLSALYSASGTVQATLKILTGELERAFIFTGFGDHHAGPDFYGGGCYFNGIAAAIAAARQETEAKRFAIIDTDAHHGDGTWAIFRNDVEVLYICLCRSSVTSQARNINLTVPSSISDAEYLDLIDGQAVALLEEHRPDIVFWNYGYDVLHGDYGDLGLRLDCPTKIASRLKDAANRLCKGRLVVVLCGGARRDYAMRTIPMILRELADI